MRKVFCEPKYKYSVVACARWEARYIVEWLNYYKAIGYDHVYLYCNDDEPYALYEKVLPYVVCKNPFVSFKFWPDVGAQFDMYLDFIENHKHETEYVSFFDIDEFLRLSRANNINEFIENLRQNVDGGFDCVYFNWCMFGNSGFETRPEGAVLSTYTRREKYFSNFMTKHITKTEKISYDKFKKGPMTDFWHYWNGVENFSDIRVVNAIGEDIGDYYDNVDKTKKKISEDAYFDAMINSAVVNHYAFKSKQDFILRARRSTRGVFIQQDDYEKAYYDGRAEDMLSRLNEVEDKFLKNFWCDYVRLSCHRIRGNLSQHLVPSAAVDVISHGKDATQSSVSEWSNSQDMDVDARGALNGVKDGHAKFHTAFEDAPWWRVDLGEPAGISEIRVYNRMDVPGVMERASRLAVDVGFSPDHLIEVYRREADEPFGGVDGNPLVFKPSIPIPGRFVRIRLLEPNYLHLDQVEVYGEPLPLMLHGRQSAAVGS